MTCLFSARVPRFCQRRSSERASEREEQALMGCSCPGSGVSGLKLGGASPEADLRREAVGLGVAKDARAW